MDDKEIMERGALWDILTDTDKTEHWMSAARLLKTDNQVQAFLDELDFEEDEYDE